MLPGSKELLQSTRLGKSHPRKAWLVCDRLPEHAQKRSSYLGFSLESCCLARSKSTSLPRATSPFVKYQMSPAEAAAQWADGSRLLWWAVGTHLLWHLHHHLPPLQPHQAPCHIPSSRDSWHHHMQTGGLSPALSLRAQSQLVWAVQMVSCTPKRQTFSLLFVSLILSPTINFFNLQQSSKLTGNIRIW